jgi:type VI protein secretion system component VasK
MPNQSQELNTQELLTRIKKLEDILYGLSDDNRTINVIRKNVVFGEHSKGKPTIIDKFGQKFDLATKTDLDGKENVGVAQGLINTHNSTYNHSSFITSSQATSIAQNIAQGIMDTHESDYDHSSL